jgi:hypothetical protein
MKKQIKAVIRSLIEFRRYGQIFACLAMATGSAIGGVFFYSLSGSVLVGVLIGVFFFPLLGVAFFIYFFVGYAVLYPLAWLLFEAPSRIKEWAYSQEQI